MKRRILCLLSAAAVTATAALMSACGGTEDLQKRLDEMTRQNAQLSADYEQLAKDKEQLQSDLAELQEDLAELSAENALTQEEIVDVEYKIKKLMGADWLGESAEYELDRLYVRVGEEYTDEVFTAEDFLPIAIAEVEQTYRCDDFSEYLLTLKTTGLKELIRAMTKLYSLDFVEETLLCENVTCEWQLAADRGGYFVCVRTALLDGPLTAEDFAPLSVSSVIPVEGVFVWTLNPESLLDNLKIYVITPEERGDGVLDALSELEIVDHAWKNEYDYEVRQYPAEEKVSYGDIPDYFLGFFGSYTIEVDKTYASRIFTIDDFAGFAAGEYVTWLSYDAFKSGEENYVHLFSVTALSHDVSHSVAQKYMKLIARIDYVKRCSPDYAITDFPGYPSDKQQSNK